MKEKVTVKIPRPLYQKIQMVIDGSGFSSPTDFITFVLRDLVGEAELHLARGGTKDEYTATDLDSVKQKLKNLGYL